MELNSILAEVALVTDLQSNAPRTARSTKRKAASLIACDDSDVPPPKMMTRSNSISPEMPSLSTSALSSEISIPACHPSPSVAVSVPVSAFQSSASGSVSRSALSATESDIESQPCPTPLIAWLDDLLTAAEADSTWYEAVQNSFARHVTRDIAKEALSMVWDHHKEADIAMQAALDLL